MRGWAGLVLWMLSLIGCAPQGQVEVVLDKPDPERLLRYYFGSYVTGGGDPFEAGLLSRRGQRYFLHPRTLEEHRAGMGAELLHHTRRNELSWDSLGAFLAGTYYRVRELPPTVAHLEAQWPYTEWEAFEVHGPMTRARRRIFLEKPALQSAIEGYLHAGQRLLYPDSTAIIAEHYVDSTLIEHTVMVRRNDGFWDFATYGADGRLATETTALPRALKTPLQCVGCHFGTKQFEPERSFPLPAPPAPEGHRAYYVADDARDVAVTTYFDEHTRRDDTVLGLYATIFVSRLRARRDSLAASDLAILNNLGL